MALPVYLAMTPEEMRLAEVFPARIGYMACHFSPDGPGLIDFPERLPEGAILILDDSIPSSHANPDLVCSQLREQILLHQCDSVLLDFQRPDCAHLQNLVRMLIGALPCPVGVSAGCSQGLDCPVFLPPLPPDIPLEVFLKPWTGREIWLEAALEGLCLTLTPEGCTVEPLVEIPSTGFQDPRLHCHYRVRDSAVFQLWRTRGDLDALLVQAECAGITRAIGLWQELA